VAGNLQGYLEYGVELVCPPSGAPAAGFGVMDFIRSGHKRTISILYPVRCREYPHSHGSPVKVTRRKIGLRLEKASIEVQRRMIAEDMGAKAICGQQAGSSACQKRGKQGSWD